MSSGWLLLLDHGTALLGCGLRVPPRFVATFVVPVGLLAIGRSREYGGL